MPEPLSKLYPGMAGEKELAVTGSLTIDTGLKEIRTADVSLKSDPVADAAFVTWKSVDGEPGKMLIEVWSDAYGASATETLVSWFALGDR